MSISCDNAITPQNIFKQTYNLITQIEKYVEYVEATNFIHNIDQFENSLKTTTYALVFINNNMHNHKIKKSFEKIIFDINTIIILLIDEVEPQNFENLKIKILNELKQIKISLIEISHSINFKIIEINHEKSISIKNINESSLKLKSLVNKSKNAISNKCLNCAH